MQKKTPASSPSAALQTHLLLYHIHFEGKSNLSFSFWHRNYFLLKTQLNQALIVERLQDRREGNNLSSPFFLTGDNMLFLQVLLRSVLSLEGQARKLSRNSLPPTCQASLKNIRLFVRQRGVFETEFWALHIASS